LGLAWFVLGLKTGWSFDGKAQEFEKQPALETPELATPLQARREVLR
jgi:hypothetical protein